MNKALRKQLRHLRIDRDLTQVETAVRAHISLSRYWRIEAGYLQPRPQELSALARVFRVPVATLEGAGMRAGAP